MEQMRSVSLGLRLCHIKSYLGPCELIITTLWIVGCDNLE